MTLRDLLAKLGMSTVDVDAVIEPVYADLPAWRAALDEIEPDPRIAALETRLLASRRRLADVDAAAFAFADILATLDQPLATLQEGLETGDLTVDPARLAAIRTVMRERLADYRKLFP